MSTATNLPTPSAPLPPAASAALSKLESAGLPVGPTALAAQLLKSRVRAAELVDLAQAGFELSPLEWDDLAHAVDLVAEAPRALAKLAEERAEASRRDAVEAAR